MKMTMPFLETTRGKRAMALLRAHPNGVHIATMPGTMQYLSEIGLVEQARDDDFWSGWVWRLSPAGRRALEGG